MKVQIYANYGVLAREKQIIFTATSPHCHAVVSDKIVVEIPEEYQPYETVIGSLALCLPDQQSVHHLDDVLGTINRRPALVWYDGRINRSVMLRIVEGEETLT